ncbi:two-component system LytT family sensor kinase [Catalinimonas alkaloidigena]|uniref:sensor histidine kinase n=1 Tax=Catalinimonas alkaloidigena TaxID=1075417 RepID=UPI0024049EA6|nr:histidine kinase [Catalinimonas alkaloidigena]MDF9798495.1 two-component system LytT family sensor kinase [Catalinimonas alkaloidigena]
MFSLFTVSTAIFAANIATVRSLDKLIPWNRNVSRRILVEILITSLNAIFIILVWTYVYFYLLNVEDEQFTSSLFNNILIALIANAIATSIMEGSAFFRAWKASLIESERMQKEYLRTKYEALKTQINPHFLFNSLNTLSSLVHTDPDLAEEFIDEFARFYRYILEIKDKSLVSLEEELSMVESYVYLQKIRFGDALMIENHIGMEHMQRQVPPLTLQLLVENAIKHNALSAEHPLTIRMEVLEQCLQISNNLQKRDEDVFSTGIGLHNLEAKYRILSTKMPEFYPKEEYFVATIPLLQKNVRNASTDY